MLIPFHFVENPGFRSWHFEPTVLVGIAVAGFLYFRWIKLHAERHPDEEFVTTKQQVMFVLGLASFIIALISPIDAWASYLLSMHMTQHILVTIVGPPLLLLGLPKAAVQSLSNLGKPWEVWRFVTRPLFAFFLFNAVFSFIHLPVLYNLILRSQAVHIAMHLALIGTALVLWWPVLAPGREYGEISPAMKILYLVANTVPGQVVGAIITLTDAPIYSEYALAPQRLWGLSLQTDQEIGGLLMWVGVGSFFLGVAGMAFFKWAADADAAERRKITGPGAASQRPRW
jgi:putative membrane protein